MKIKIFILLIALLATGNKNALAITTASKTSEDSFEASSAVYVISRNDIKRSGATSIADVLRTVPGLQVAEAEPGQWLVTSRGFANGFANKLLVMVDGRTVYTPLFSGVHWNLQMNMLENIKQIEIIRGPGATQWGANAVNGVINIITEPANNTQSTLLSGVYGNRVTSSSARYGGKIKDNSYYRVYASKKRQYNFKKADNTDANRNVDIHQGGFRVDYDEFEKDQITLQSDIYHGETGLDFHLPTLIGEDRLQDNISVYGGNVLTKWQRKINDYEETTLQAYYDRAIRDYSLLSRRTVTYDLDFQYSKIFDSGHEVTSGLGYRDVHSNLKGNSFLIFFNPIKRNTKLYSAFIQDKITLIPKKFLVTLGSKFEHNSFTGFEFQPSIKSSWLIDEDQTLWFSVSRATRTPNISENDIKMVVGTVNSNIYSRQQGSRNYDSEKLISYETGYRIRPTNNSLINLALFYNDYDNLRSAERAGVTSEDGNNFFSVFPENNGEGKTYGLEIDANLKLKRWELKAAYTYLKMDLDTKTGSKDTELEKEEERSPKHQFNIQSRLNITERLTFDNILYYVDSITVSDNELKTLEIPSYYRFDTNIGWQYSEKLSFNLVGQNLFDDKHIEFSGSLWDQPMQSGRTIYGKATLKF